MSVNKKIIETEAQVPVEDAFNVKTWTGNYSTQTISGYGFQPDLVWIKNRNQADSHCLYDSTRGANKRIESDTSDGEVTATNELTAFTSDGFSLGSSGLVNASTISYVGWGWRANGGVTSSNTDGSITSTVQANQDSGFSIVKYTGTGSNATIGHGLSAAPEMMIIKNLDQADSWVVYHSAVGTSQFLPLSTTDAASGSGDIFGTPNDTGVAPTSTVFTVGSNHKSGANGENYIAYCFNSVDGYSKIGAFTGNGSCDTSNAIQNCGFRPDFVVLKNATDGGHWGMFDSARGGTGQNNKQLTAESNGAEYTGLDSCDYVKFEDTGFRVTTGNSAYNGSGKQIIYMAFRIAS